MARYNEILVGRFNRHLQKLLSLKGGPPAPQLATDIAANLTFFTGVEELYLQSINRFAASNASTGAGAVTSGWRIRNPATSQVVIVIESLGIQAAVQDNTLGVSHGPVTTDLTTVVGVTLDRLDPRGNPQPIAVISVGTSPGVFGATIANFFVSANPPANNLQLIYNEHQEIPILPGDGLQVATAAVNDNLFVSVTWRERFLEDSERT